MKFVYFILLLCWVIPAFSCQCVYGIGEADVHYKNADRVFHARIISTEIQKSKDLSLQLPLDKRESFLMLYPEHLEAHYVLLENVKGHPLQIWNYKGFSSWSW